MLLTGQGSKRSGVSIAADLTVPVFHQTKPTSPLTAINQ
jgi:hypothetical protein